MNLLFIRCIVGTDCDQHLKEVWEEGKLVSGRAEQRPGGTKPVVSGTRELSQAERDEQHNQRKTGNRKSAR